MVTQARDRGWSMIVGAQVGETSILTRAGMVLARAMGGALRAMEGGAGLHLLTRDPVAPVLQFGAGGAIDLAQIALEPAGLGLRWSSDDGMA